MNDVGRSDSLASTLEAHSSRSRMGAHGLRPGGRAAALRLRTARLDLRPLALDDLDAVASLFGDAKALIYWGGPLDRDGARRWIERNLARYEADGFGRCAVILRATGGLIGDCGLITTMVEAQREVELGWVVRRSAWGQGIATEAGAAWRDFAFATAGLTRIVSLISAPNVASRRVAEKLGFTLEREALWDGIPHLMYALDASGASGGRAPAP